MYDRENRFFAEDFEELFDSDSDFQDQFEITAIPLEAGVTFNFAGSNDLEMGMSTAEYLSNLTRVRDTARAAGMAEVAP